MPSFNKKDAIFSVMSIIIATLLTLLPAGLLSVISQGLVAAVIGYTVIKHHYSFVSVICLINFVIYLIFSGNILVALFSSIPIILCGLTLGICYNLKFSASRLLTIFTGVFVLNTVFNIKITEIAQKGQNVFNEIIYFAGDIYRETLIGASGGSVPLSQIDEIVSEVTSLLLRFSPSFIVISCILFSLISYYLFRRLCQIRKVYVSCFAKFSEWKSDKFISVTFLVLTLFSFIAPENSFLSDVILNMVTVMAFVFFIFGLSYIEFKLENKFKKSFVRKFILIVISSLSLIFIGLPFMAISFIGAICGISDLRSKNIKPQF